jgi:hypothetical protein
MNARMFVALVIASAIAAQARGQGPTPAPAASAPPESVTVQFMESMRNGDWQGMARLMHPAALHQLKDLLDPVMSAPGVDDMREQVLGVRSAAAAKAMSDTAVFVALMKTMMGSDPMLVTVMKTARVQVIGHLNEGADTVHVVYRLMIQIDSMPITRLDVASFARSPLGWRGLLKGDMTALAAQLKRMVPAQD